MKNILCIYVFLALIFNFGESAIWRISDSRNDEYPGKCYYGKVKPALILSPGETTIVRGECSKANCNKDFSMSFSSCLMMHVEGCEISVGDWTKDYPDCCPRQVCPKDLSSLYFSS